MLQIIGHVGICLLRTSINILTTLQSFAVSIAKLVTFMGKVPVQYISNFKNFKLKYLFCNVTKTQGSIYFFMLRTFRYLNLTLFIIQKMSHVQIRA